ncbi:MAG: ribonuclease Z [Ruminococcaceae bacterium]|nr:ribonuclease Z [Oscillospiraceae bacterium]
MTVFVCVDDNMGVAFNNRRQSRDSAIVSTVMEMTRGKKLYMNEYSKRLFSGEDVIVCENYMDIAEENDFCFAENVSLAEYNEKIKTVVLFKWNKIYPNDKKLEISFEDRELQDSFDFVGSSHDKITCEVWTK